MIARNPNYSRLPTHVQYSMQRYIERGWLPGDFLRLIICNDLVHAAGYADCINQGRFLDFCTFLINDMPMQAWGSVEKYNTWIAHGGMNGLAGFNEELGIEHG